MRLIDAEALLELFDKECARECDNCVYYEKCIGHQYCGLIDKAPTIEERPKGKWIEVDNGLVSGRCSLCGWEAVIMETDVCGMPFCPHCGADMRGDV